MVVFRNDIQCLRGLALLFVYFYHYSKSICPSGFIGVDIFFFISGYVNTLSYFSKPTNSFKAFTFNRVKRLFPVSHLCIYISIITVKRMNVFYQRKQFNDIIYATISLSNYRFIYLSVDYLSQNDIPSIVLHFWSLAAEDQFYFFFPCFISYIYLKKYMLVILLNISLLYSCYININNHSIAYFSFLSRSWQFIFGIYSTKFNRLINFRNEIILLISLILVFFMKNDLLFPSPLSLYPLFLVHLLLLMKYKEIISKNIVLLKLGNISYSFYLLHYLIIYIFNNKKKSISICSFIFLFTIFLSSIVYKYYEIPFRKYKNLSKIFHYYIISSIIIICVCIALMKKTDKNFNKIYKFRNYNNKLHYNGDKYQHVKSDFINYSYDFLKKEFRDFQSNQYFCPILNKNMMNRINNHPIVLLLADSHGEQWFNSIIPYSIENNYVVIHVYFWEDTILTYNLKKLYKLFRIVQNVHYIVVSHYLLDDSNIILFNLHFNKYLKYLLNYCYEIYVIHDTPHFHDDPNLCLLSTTNYDNCYYIIGINATYREFPVLKNYRIHYISMIKYICFESYKCYSLWNSIPIYLDNNHLTLQYTKMLKPFLLKQFHFHKQNKTQRLNFTFTKSFKCSYYKDL